jgi:hypothetical protein
MARPYSVTENYSVQAKRLFKRRRFSNFTVLDERL